jgi:G3E family GTPase
MRATVIVADGGTQGVVDTWLEATASAKRAVFVEGVFTALELPADVAVTRLASGCVCCQGQVPLRVGITRAVRALRPDELLLVLSRGEHLERVRALLADGSLGVRFELTL